MTAPPFFILGCVRSGTTMLRDLLRSVPDLCCPEETHFYRWAHPFATPQFKHQYVHNKVLAKHRELDGVTDDDIAKLFHNTKSRAEFFDGYMERFIAAQGLPAGTRWFDKTPQNVFGAHLLGFDYPDSKFVHLYRNPRNVVASLKKGVVMHVENPVAGANYWRESELMAASFERANPGRMLSVSYQELTNDPRTQLDAICSFIDLGPLADDVVATVTPEKDGYADVLDEREVALVDEICGPAIAELGYVF